MACNSRSPVPPTGRPGTASAGGDTPWASKSSVFALLREELPSRPLGPAQPGAQLPGPPPLPGGAAGPPREKAHKAERERKRSKKEKKEKKVLTHNSFCVYLRTDFVTVLPASHGQSGQRRCAGSLLYLHRRTVCPAPDGSGLPVPTLQGGTRERYSLSHLTRANLASHRAASCLMSILMVEDCS